MNMGVSNFVIAIPEIYLILLGFIILISGIFSNASNENEKRLFFQKLFYLYIFALLSSLFLIYSTGISYSSAFKGLFIVSPSIYIIKIILISFVVLRAIIFLPSILMLDINFIKVEEIAISLFLLCGCLFLVSSNNLLSFYVALELVTICTYALIFMDKSFAFSTEAGLKYFVLGALATGFMLYGISLIYGFTGYVDFIAIKNSITDFSANWILLIGIIMFIIGISFKLSLAPFHMWTPDVYKGVSYSTNTLLIIIVKIAVLFIFVRVLWEAFPSVYNMWAPIIKVLIMISAIVGYILAINQHKIKGFLAYSSIANMAYVLLAMLNMTNSSLIYIIIYVTIYSISVLGFIGIIVFLRKNNECINDIYSLTGLASQRPYLAFALVIFLLSMAGIPITAGFFAKVLILISSLSSGLYVLSLVVTLLSIVIMYFYFKIIKIMYFDKDPEAYYVYKIRFLSVANIAIVFLVIVTVGFVFVLNPLISYLEYIITFI